MQVRPLIWRLYSRLSAPRQSLSRPAHLAAPLRASSIRPTTTDGRFDVCFGTVKVATIDLGSKQQKPEDKDSKTVNHVSEQV